MRAGIELLRRTGLRSFQLRYSDDEEPVVWLAVGEWRVGPDGRPARDGEVGYEAAASTEPPLAIMRLLDEVIDGGHCPACEQPTSVVHDGHAAGPLLGALTCAWAYDAERKCYVRSCDGKEAKRR